MAKKKAKKKAAPKPKKTTKKSSSSSSGLKVTTDSSGRIVSASDSSGSYSVDSSGKTTKTSSSKAKPAPLPILKKPVPSVKMPAGKQPAAAGGAGLQMDYNRAIADIYAQRPDLQGLYGPDGRAKDPNDPRVQGIPTILDWAEQYGSKEHGSLQGYTKRAQNAPPFQEEGEFPSTGDPALDAILAQLQAQIQAQQEAGQMINPKIELTPSEVKKFLDQATGEIDPYYAEQITSVRQDLDRNLDELEQSYQLQKKQYESDFKENLGSKREDLAGVGLTFSGARGQQEKALVENQGRQLEASAAAAGSRAAKAIADTESKIGSRNLSSLSMPNLVEYGASTEGTGGLTARRTLNFGTQGNVTGDLEYNKNRDIRALSDYFQQQEITRRTLNF